MDTVYLVCDTIVAKFNAGNNIRIVSEGSLESGANWQEVLIALLICAAFCFVAYRVIRLFVERKKPVEDENMTELINAVKKLVEEKEKNDIEKRKSDYTKRLADFLEELSKNEKNARFEGIDSAACQKYIALLTVLAKDGKIDNFNIKSLANGECVDDTKIIENNNSQADSNDVNAEAVSNSINEQ